MAFNLFAQVNKLRKPVQKRINELEDELSKLRHFLTGLVGGGEVGNGRTSMKRGPKPKAMKRKSGKRERRSSEQLNAYADEVYQFVKSHDGCSGPDIRKKFPKVGIDIKGFVKQYGGGKKVISKGASRTPAARKYPSLRR